MVAPTSAGYILALLLAINTLNFFDRQILGAVAEPLRLEWQMTDSQLGWLGTAFTLLYAAVGVPLGRWTDRASRTRLLAAGVLVWSLFTALSGLAQSFWQLFWLRLGVGVGEATCAPAAISLIGDVVPPARRARALSLFMAGLPAGVALSYFASGRIAAAYGWRQAFFIAALPGLLCALLALACREPARGGREEHAIGTRQRPGSPYLLVLGTPTMVWLILSGALHNFNAYALGSFLAPFIMRFHGVAVEEAGDVSMAVSGLSGLAGLLLGGLLADRLARRWRHGRLLAGAGALLFSAPLTYLALQRPAGDLAGFAALMGLGAGLMYVYYSAVYSTIQDVIEPALRGTAMALYFFAMYVLGAALGPAAIGALSDHLTRGAALAAGLSTATPEALEPFRARGLHAAMHLIPLLGLLLAAVLFAATATVGRDVARLRSWMRAAAGAGEGPAAGGSGGMLGPPDSDSARGEAN